MTSASQKFTNIHNFNTNYHKIASLRSKLAKSAQLVQQLDSIVDTYNASIQENTKTVASLQISIKNILNNFKQAHSTPNEWLTQFLNSRAKQKQAALLLESKMFQFNEICHSVATNSIVIDTLNIIKSNKQTQLNLNELNVPNSKKQFLAFYKEACQYYMFRQKIVKNKTKNVDKGQDLLKVYPELRSCQLFRQQIEETIKQEKYMKKISLIFCEIQQKLLGFSREDNKVMNYQQINQKLEKLLAYIKQSCNFKQSQKIAPNNVKQHNQIINILTLLSNSNVGILQETILQQPNQQIKSICNKLIQSIIKNSKNSDLIYEFLVQNINEKDIYKYAKNVKQLPLERKLIQSQKLIKQLRKYQTPKKNNQIQSKIKQNQSSYRKYESIIQELNSLIFDKDNKLLLAEEQIFSLQNQLKCFQRQKKELISEKLNYQQKIEQLKYQNEQLFKKLSNNEDQYQKINIKNKQLEQLLQQTKINNKLIQSQLDSKQYQNVRNTQRILYLTTQLNIISLQKDQILRKIKEKEQSCKFESKIIDLLIQPTIQQKSMQQVINLIQDVRVNMNNNQLYKHSQTPSPPKRDRFPIKHSRSFSNVDFLSQLMPQIIIQKDAQRDNLSTLDSEQLKKGIQIRQKTIKKYEIYMQKQRKEAKKHRSYILQLQSKIRSLQIQQIRLKQLVDDQNQQKILQLDQLSCRSLINIEDSPQKPQQIKSIQKIAEKEVQLKVKQEQINFKIQEIIKHVLKLNTLKVNSQHFSQNQTDSNNEEFLPDTYVNPQNKNTQETQ